MEQQLQRDGWSLTEKGIQYCQRACASSTPAKVDVIRNALHTDIREIGKQTLPADINKGKITEISGPIVLQIQKIRNISAPSIKEDSGAAPRMLRILLTDGVINCTAVEIEPVQIISLSTPPGSKICLNGNISIQHGFLLLSSNSFKFLGGEVEHLKSKWEISQNVSKLQRKVLTAEGGPPLFVPFDENSFANRKPQPITAVQNKEPAVKSTPKAKPSGYKQEKSAKPPPQEKKIWKSEPQEKTRKKAESDKIQKDISAHNQQLRNEQHNKAAQRNQNQRSEKRPVENDKKSNYFPKEGAHFRTHEHAKRDLPPRLEQNRQNERGEASSSYKTNDINYTETRKNSSGTARDAKKDMKLDKKVTDSSNYIDKDIEQVVDLINKRMKMNEPKASRAGPQRGGRSDYDKGNRNERNYEQNQRFVHHKGKPNNESFSNGKDRVTSYDRSKDDKDSTRKKNDHIDSTRDRNGAKNNQVRSRDQDRTYHSDNAKKNAFIQTKRNDSANGPALEQYARGKETAKERLNNPTAANSKKENEVKFEGRPGKYNDKVSQFISDAASANSGLVQMMGQERGYLMENPMDVAFKQSSMPNAVVQQPPVQQTSMQRFPQTTYSHQQQLLTSTGQLIYVPAYSQDVYQSTFNSQGYQTTPNQDYQQGQRYQAPIIHQANQYQQGPGSPFYLQNPAMPNHGLQNAPMHNHHGMHPPGFGLRGHPRPRIRHDVYRPKT